MISRLVLVGLLDLVVQVDSGIQQHYPIALSVVGVLQQHALRLQCPRLHRDWDGRSGRRSHHEARESGPSLWPKVGGLAIRATAFTEPNQLRCDKATGDAKFGQPFRAARVAGNQAASSQKRLNKSLYSNQSTPAAWSGPKPCLPLGFRACLPPIVGLLTPGPDRARCAGSYSRPH